MSWNMTFPNILCFPFLFSTFLSEITIRPTKFKLLPRRQLISSLVSRPTHLSSPFGTPDVGTNSSKHARSKGECTWRLSVASSLQFNVTQVTELWFIFFIDCVYTCFFVSSGLQKIFQNVFCVIYFYTISRRRCLLSKRIKALNVT